MTATVLTPETPRRNPVERFLGEFTSHDRAVAQRARNLAIFVAVVIVAYHYSLSTLFKTLQSDTPLAYLGLVPLIALGLAAVRSRPSAGEPAIHDREVDYIVGVPLLLASLAVNIFMPVRLSSFFWLWRIDLLALPLFVAGAIALLFGVRTLWRGRIPILFLFLAWPLPYTTLLNHGLQSFTNVTIAAVNGVLKVVPVAHRVSGGDGSIFQIVHGSKAFPVSIASACSGVNGVVGYALVAIAFLAIVHGRFLAKIAWLILGLVLVWALNVVRIMMILAAGAQWGERIAIDGLHPYLGLVTFSVGVLIMLMLMGRFGLEVNVLNQPSASDLPSNGSRPASNGSPPLPPSGPAAPPPDSKPSPVPRTRLAVTIVVILAIVSGIVNTSLQSFDAVADAVGAPRLESFVTHPAHPNGWLVYRVAEFDWATQFFGSDATWWRYNYHWNEKTPTQFKTNATITADVITTSDPSTFSTYGIEACYDFHGYSLKAVNTIELGGIVGHVVAYENSAHQEWTNVYWINPVATSAGTRYERVNLLLINSSHTAFSGPLPSPSLARSLGIQIENALTGSYPGSGPQLDKTRAFLAAFAANIIEHQKPAPTSATE